MIQSITSQGLVLYNRNFREDDKLVKIFTEQAGKRMFFVKHAWPVQTGVGYSALVLARFLLRINDDGLSYIEDYHEVMTFPRLIAISLSWPMRPMWRLLQMLVCRIISRMLPCLLFLQKIFGIDGSWLGLSSFDYYF